MDTYGAALSKELRPIPGGLPQGLRTVEILPAKAGAGAAEGKGIFKGTAGDICPAGKTVVSVNPSVQNILTVAQGPRRTVCGGGLAFMTAQAVHHPGNRGEGGRIYE